jgi:transposase
MKRIFVGLDVSKDRLEVHVRPTDERFEAAYDEAGVATLLSRLTGPAAGADCARSHRGL